MQAHIKLGRIFGVQVGLHYSWLLITLLVTLSLAGQFGAMNPQWGAGVIWATAIVTGLLFFAAIVAHEMSHALVARARNIPVRAITLFALGGVAQIEKDAADAKTEFWMGIVGPITSAVIGFACLGLAMLMGWTPDATLQAPMTPLQAMLMWLGVINIALAIFNMIPGFPMDGGRVLRAVIWWTTGDVVRATLTAARVGQLIGFALIVFGIFRFFGGAGFGGLWLAFIGWFLLRVAGSARAHVETNENLRGVRVGDVMSRNCPVVDARDNLQTFVDEHPLRTGRRCFVVEGQGRIAGLITPHEVKAVERAKWRYTAIEDAMRPLDHLHTIGTDAPVSDALELMGRGDVNQLPVVRDGQLAGVILRGDVLRLLRTRAELQV